MTILLSSHSEREWMAGPSLSTGHRIRAETKIALRTVSTIPMGRRLAFLLSPFLLTGSQSQLSEAASLRPGQ